MALSTTDSFENSTSNITFFDTRDTYESILKLQNRIVDQLSLYPENKKVFVLAGEHPPTYTSGKSVSDDKIDFVKSMFNGAVVKTERGGQFMYHGPGQLTLYFIFNLKQHFSGPREYVEYLFNSVKDYFEDRYELELEYKNQGLWLNDKKVGFMGIRVKKGIVYHGISLNYYTDLEPFIKQSPCDISGEQAGNLFSSPLATLFIKDEAKNVISNISFKEV